MSGSQTSQEKQSRRFSFIPASFSLKAIGIGKEEDGSQQPQQQQPVSQPDLPIQEPPATADQSGRYRNQSVGREHVEATTLDGMYAQLQLDEPRQESRDPYGGAQYGRPPGVESYSATNVREPSFDTRRAPGSAPHLQSYPTRPDEALDGRRGGSTNNVAGSKAPAPSNPTPPAPVTAAATSKLQKNKRFVDAWEDDPYTSQRPHDHSGSSGPAKKVMDFFRRRGKARGGESG